MLSVGSLFSGAGLCDLGFHMAGFRHQFFCESDPFCRSILSRHWPHVPIYNDVREVSGMTAPKVDILVGGFPCQDVSSAGSRAGIKQGTRSGLWYEYARIISEMRPRWAVIENVKGLLSKGMGIVLSELSSIGYDAEWTCLPAAAVGAPHLRQRIFIVAYPDGCGIGGQCRVLAPLDRDLGANDQPGRSPDWLGVPLDWTTRASIRAVYGRCVLRRVADGTSGGLDFDQGRESGGVLPLTPQERKDWHPRLKAIGNGICPQQSYRIAQCILQAEGLV
jgi:DNA (cytosine-5)-methyltransferase 1